jgi:nitrogen-specific signal transduction histidine kinase/CheY-like chemotaxis protein
VVFSINLFQDLTERKRTEDQLRQAQKMEIVGQLTGGVAHDFNNILAVVVGNLELAADRTKGNSEVEPLVDAALDAAWRGASLTQRLLAFSRKQALMPQTVDAHVLLEGMGDLLRRTLEETVGIEFMGSDDLWMCEVDPNQLENAILNLAINARDAMPDGGRLTIEAENVTLDDDYANAQADVAPGQYVMLAVTDTGAGMPQEIVDQVFDPFFTTKEIGSGSGLGLSMVFGFVKQSGGHVTIYSEEGVGTTVKLYLPRSQGEDATIPSAEPSEIPRGRGETILVVEDDPNVRTLSVALLSDLGYDVLEAADGPSALLMLETSSHVNLLFTDVVLPGGMRGPELAAEIMRRQPGIAVLYTSGYTENAIIHRGRLEEGVELLSKPFRREDLARKVRAVIDKSYA